MEICRNIKAGSGIQWKGAADDDDSESPRSNKGLSPWIPIKKLKVPVPEVVSEEVAMRSAVSKALPRQAPRSSKLHASVLKTTPKAVAQRHAPQASEAPASEESLVWKSAEISKSAQVYSGRERLMMMTRKVQEVTKA